MDFECLKEYLNYCPNSGVFTWLKTHSNYVKVGQIAGNIQHGYLYITFKQKRYRAHRLAWFYHYGHWPKQMIDHINGNRLDNSINNLRDVSSKENQRNMACHRNGQSVGYWRTKEGRMAQYLKHKGKK